MRTLFMGTPEFAVAPLQYLVLNHHQVIAVYTQPDRPAGRGRELLLSPVKTAALKLNIPVVQPPTLKKPEAVAELAAYQPEVIIVAAYGQILPQAVLDLPKYGCLNIHPSLLPKYRGASPVAAAILAGDDFSGVSIMRMEAGLDTGAVLVRAPIAISARDTTGTLTAKLALVAARLLVDVLPRWVAGEITPRPQDNAEATYSGSISKEAGEIDWHLPAVQIWRRVRAFQPWPGCYAYWQGKRLNIIEAQPRLGEGTYTVGQVLALEKAETAFGVGTGEGVLAVARVQLAGKKEMTGAEFLRGQRGFIGAVLGRESTNIK